MDRDSPYVGVVFPLKHIVISAILPPTKRDFLFSHVIFYIVMGIFIEEAFMIDITVPLTFPVVITLGMTRWRQEYSAPS